MTASPLTAFRILKVCGLLAVLVLLLSVLALSVGAVGIPLRSILSTLTGSTSALSPQDQLILLEIRLPRIGLAILVGASLGVAGAAYQALLRNPLADPYVLGVSSGAALGAIFSFAFAAWVAIATPLAAFLGAAATIAAVYFLGRQGGQLAPYTLLLAGVITASFLSAVIIFLMNFLSGRDLRGAAYWLMGDLSNPSPVALSWLSLFTLLAISVILFVAGDLNLLLSGEPEAAQLGVNVRRTKLLVYLAASLATALAVSVSGAIGYVGLLVPHLVRLLFGGDYRLLIPASALTGAAFLLAADTVARTIIAPTELPVGAVTAVIGAPVFIYLLRRPQTQRGTP